VRWRRRLAIVRHHPSRIRLVAAVADWREQVTAAAVEQRPQPQCHQPQNVGLLFLVRDAAAAAAAAAAGGGLGRRSNLRFGPSFSSAPGTPPQHGNADGGTAMTDVSHADHLAAELANTAQEVVFAQSDKMTVTFSEALPTEVRGVIGRGGTPLHLHG